MSDAESGLPASPAPPLRIAVCGGGRARGEDVHAAERVGRGLAERGAVLVCGGLGGIMEAASRGAASAGGLTVGLLPGTDAGAANLHIRLPLPTGLGEARNALIARAAEAVIAIGGEWGTLSEIALARKIDTPVVLLRPGLAAGLDELHTAETAEAAVHWALEHAQQGRPS